MKIGKHILVVLILLAIGVGVSVFRPANLSLDPRKLFGKSEPVNIKPPMPLLDTLKQILHAQKVQKLKNGQQVWTLENGLPLPVYLLNAQNAIHAKGGQIVSMQEADPRAKMPNHILVWKDEKGTLYTYQLKFGDEYRLGSSKIALAFLLQSPPDSQDIQQIKQLNMPVTLLINPFQIKEDSAWHLQDVPNTETVVWLGMEPHNYPNVRAGLKPILINYDAEEIEKIFAEAQKRLPNAIGVGTFKGDLAVEQENLLTMVYTATKRRNWWFIDLTNSRFSKALDVCRKVEMRCAQANPQGNNISTDDYLSNVLKIAAKTGSGMALLPLEESNLKKITAMQDNAKLQGTEFVPMSQLIPNF